LLSGKRKGEANDNPEGDDSQTRHSKRQSCAPSG
jgi:hypothetical protein